jgi:hypothetical protein
MFRHTSIAILLLLLVTPQAHAKPGADGGSPALMSVPELAAGFRLLYQQDFSGAREKFNGWASQHPEEPFGPVAVAASYLFEEFNRQGVLTSDFFLDDKKFLKGIEGKPDAARMRGFQGAIAKARSLANARRKKTPNDPEALYALTLAAGMQSDAASILEKKDLEALKRLKEANEYAKKLLAQQPDANDAYVALGAANYIIGSLTKAERMLLWFGGIHGDKKLGMEQLQKTVNGGRYLQPFAKILLALSARREKQNALAQKLLRELSEEFPENPSFAAEYAKAMGRPIPAVMHP